MIILTLISSKYVIKTNQYLSATKHVKSTKRLSKNICIETSTGLHDDMINQSDIAYDNVDINGSINVKITIDLALTGSERS